MVQYDVLYMGALVAISVSREQLHTDISLLHLLTIRYRRHFAFNSIHAGAVKSS